jgi:hypothetical protein
MRKSNKGGELAQSTLYALWKYHDETPLYN